MTSPTDHDRLPPDDPDRLLRLISRADRLEALPRTGWLICGVTEPESVAAHIYMVTLIAMWIADHLDEPVDTEAVLRMALLHDIGESLLTDLPSPVKRFMGKEAVQEAEIRAAEQILKDGAPMWGPHFMRYEEFDSLEARVVKAADRIQMLSKALIYQIQHRGETERFWLAEHNFDDFGIPLVRRVLDRLRQRWRQGEWWRADFD